MSTVSDDDARSSSSRSLSALQPSDYEDEDEDEDAQEIGKENQTEPSAIDKTNRRRKPSRGKRRKKPLPEGWKSVFEDAPPLHVTQPRDAPQDQPQADGLTQQLLRDAPPIPARPEDGWLVVDLFSSIGLVSVGATARGNRVVLAVEMEQWRLDVHKINHPTAEHLCVKLGEETEDMVADKIKSLIPEDQWHRSWIHASPPCTCQSGIRHVGKKRTHTNFKDLDGEKEDNHALVRWTIRFIRRLNPAQFSIEEVDDRLTAGTGLSSDSGVRGAMSAAARANPKDFAFSCFQMSLFGVPQSRKRLIAARPATVWQLLHCKALRVRAPVTVAQAMAARELSPPPEVVYIQGPTVRTPKKAKMRPSPKTQGKYTDGSSDFYNIRTLLAPTVTSGHLFCWLDADFTKHSFLTVEQTAVLMTVPPEFAWALHPRQTRAQERLVGLANGIPPLFMGKVFDAATTL